MLRASGSICALLAAASCGGETVGSSRVSDGPRDANGSPVDARTMDGRVPGRDEGGVPPVPDASLAPPLPDAGPTLDGKVVRDAIVAESATNVDTGSDVTAPPAAVAYLDGDLLDVRIDLTGAFESTYLVIDSDGDPATPRTRKVNVDVLGGAYSMAVTLDSRYGVGLDACRLVALDATSHQLRILVPRVYVDAARLARLTVGVRDAAPTIVPTVVASLPAFGGKPLCTAGLGDPGAIAAGTYLDLWASEGLSMTPRLCALTTSGEPTCWGSAGDVLPTLPSGPFDALGAPHAGGLCARRAAGTVECWPIASGGGTQGPVPPPGGSLYTRLSPNGPCAILGNGDVRCWSGASPDAGVVDRAGPYVDVSGGPLQGCAVRSTGELDCWGYEADGGGRSVPVEVLPDGFKGVASTSWAVCAIGAGGSVGCVIEGHSDVQVLYGEPLVRLSGAGSICALDAAGTAACLGRVHDLPSAAFKAVRTGELTTPHCGILLDGRLACWSTDANLLFP